jgi:AhpD family alkylhydroperoxidase
MYDLKNFTKLKKIAATSKLFENFALKSGVLGKRYGKLMALTAAFKTQCSYCIEVVNRLARSSEATEEKIAEAVMVSMALRAGAALTHAIHCFAD